MNNTELTPGEFYVPISGRFKGRLGRAFSYCGEPCTKIVFLDNGEEISFYGAFDELKLASNERIGRWYRSRMR